jgi:ribosome-associated translation inhibitor RaiA
MQIQINTDKNINGDERHEYYFTPQITEAFTRYKSYITRIEVHLKDENGKKDGIKDKTCSLEARLEGRKPIAVTSHESTVELSINSAIEKMKSSLETILGRTQNY